MVSFKINSDGRVSDVTLLESANELLDAEALRVVSESPDWTPGAIGGKPVAVMFAIPIVFKID